MGVPPYKTPGGGVISNKLLLYIAWRNLVSKKLRTFLTVFGVVIGISAIYFLTSFGLGLRNLVANQVIGDQSIKSIEVTTTNSKIIKLDAGAVTRFQKSAHADGVGRQFSYPGTIRNKGGESDAVAYGIDESYESLSNISTSAGRTLRNGDTNMVMINQAAAAAAGFATNSEALGKTVQITIPLQGVATLKKEISDTFTVVGIVDSGAGSEIFIPAGLFEAAGVGTYSQVKVLADDVDNVSTLRKHIESQGFQTASPIDTLDQINQVFKFFTIILIGFGGIGMIVSVLGMFNTLTISLLERTKEIGLMIALGGRSKDMRKLFIFEAMLLSFMGAVVGILLAVFSGTLVNLVINQLARGRGVKQSITLFSNPLWVILTLVAFMMVVGLLVVLFPARRAQRINPIDALRRE
jgi:putative ABC transport system permease protein